MGKDPTSVPNFIVGGVGGGIAGTLFGGIWGALFAVSDSIAASEAIGGGAIGGTLIGSTVAAFFDTIVGALFGGEPIGGEAVESDLFNGIGSDAIVASAVFVVGGIVPGIVVEEDDGIVANIHVGGVMGATFGAVIGLGLTGVSGGFVAILD